MGLSAGGRPEEENRGLFFSAAGCAVSFFFFFFWFRLGYQFVVNLFSSVLWPKAEDAEGRGGHEARGRSASVDMRTTVGAEWMTRGGGVGRGRRGRGRGGGKAEDEEAEVVDEGGGWMEGGRRGGGREGKGGGVGGVEGEG